MNKQEFLKELEIGIKKLPKNEIESTLSYYDELIDDKVEDTKLTETQVIEQMESPTKIAKNILADEKLNVIIKRTAKKTKENFENSNNKALFIILLILASPFLIAIACVLISLFIAILSVAFAIFVAFISVAFSFFITNACLILYGASSIIYGLMNTSTSLINAMYGGLSLGLGLMLIIPSYKFMILLGKASVKVFVYLIKLIFKGAKL